MATNPSKAGTPRKYKRLRFRKNDPIHNLYAAVQHYVYANDGTIAVIGGIQIQEWPLELPYHFQVSVKCTGLKPKFKAVTK